MPWERQAYKLPGRQRDGIWSLARSRHDKSKAYSLRAVKLRDTTGEGPSWIVDEIPRLHYGVVHGQE